MKLFSGRKRQDEEEDYEEVEEVVVKRRPKSESFRDLKPENRKRRKEPKKPWGRPERLFVLFAILLTTGGSGILALSARSWKLPGLPRISIPRLTLPSFLDEETIIIEGRKKDQEKMTKAIEAFTSKTQKMSGIWGLYVIRLSNGFSYGVNEEEIFQAASLIKLPVMAGLYIQSEENLLDLDGKYTLKSSDKITGSGGLYSKPTGYEITYRNLIRLMGKQSDNTAFNIARKTLGDEKFNEIITKIGMSKTSLAENLTTPKDIGLFFEELMNGNVVNSENRNELLGFLTDTSYEAWISAGIPEGTQFAHKYGREVHVVNDAGIVQTDEPFVIVILSKGVIEKEADENFPELARIIYEIETGE